MDKPNRKLIRNIGDGIVAALVALVMSLTIGVAYASTITQIQGTDRITDSRATINTNFNNLNSDKVELAGDLSGSTGTPRIVISGMNTGCFLMASTTARIYCFPTSSSAGYVLMATPTAPYASFEAAPITGLKAFATTTAGINGSTTTDTLTLFLRNTLAVISGRSTTTGNLLMGSDADAWVSGTLVAGSNITLTTSTPGQITIAASGGSGTAYNTFDWSLNPAGAAMPTSSQAAVNKKIGTYWTQLTLDFDGSSAEYAFYNPKFPAFTALNACTVTGSVFADATSTGNVGVIAVSYQDRGDTEAWDAVASTTASTSVTVGTVAAGSFRNFSLSLTTTSFSSADTLMLALHRRPAESDDNDGSDIRYANGKLICTYR